MADGPVIDAYCDESNDHAGPQFMVFGTMVLKASDYDQIGREIREWRKAQTMNREMKWVKVKNQYVSKYLSLIDLFKSLATRDLVHFKSIVFDKRKVDYRTFHGGDKLRGRYVFFYYFLLHKVCCYANDDSCRIRIFFDDRTDTYPLRDFKRILNAGMCKKYGRSGEIVRAVEPISSKDADLVQIADVLMGAIAFQYNRNHLAKGACQAKIAVANHIAKSFGLSSLATSTLPAWVRFSIWRFRLRE